MVKISTVQKTSASAKLRIAGCGLKESERSRQLGADAQRQAIARYSSTSAIELAGIKQIVHPLIHALPLFSQLNG